MSVKVSHQLLAHSPEGGVVQIGVICDERQDARARLLDAPLAEAYELDVVVL